MNGLCEQCQVYYPMPEDFGRGVPYACPQCQALLVPFVTEVSAPYEAEPEKDSVGAAAESVEAESGFAEAPGDLGETVLSGDLESSVGDDTVVGDDEAQRVLAATPDAEGDELGLGDTTPSADFTESGESTAIVDSQRLARQAEEAAKAQAEGEIEEGLGVTEDRATTEPQAAAATSDLVAEEASISDLAQEAQSSRAAEVAAAQASTEVMPAEAMPAEAAVAEHEVASDQPPLPEVGAASIAGPRETADDSSDAPAPEESLAVVEVAELAEHEVSLDLTPTPGQLAASWAPEKTASETDSSVEGEPEELSDVDLVELDDGGSRSDLTPLPIDVEAVEEEEALEPPPIDGIPGVPEPTKRGSKLTALGAPLGGARPMPRSWACMLGERSEEDEIATDIDVGAVSMVLMQRPATVHWFYPHPSAMVEEARVRSETRSRQSFPASVEVDEDEDEYGTASEVDEESLSARDGSIDSDVTFLPVSGADAQEPLMDVEEPLLEAPSDYTGERIDSDSSTLPNFKLEEVERASQSSASAYTMKGAGQGQARDEIPSDTMGALAGPGLTDDGDLALRKRRRKTRKAAATSKRAKKRYGPVFAFMGLLLLIGSAVTWWGIGMPGLELLIQDGTEKTQVANAGGHAEALERDSDTAALPKEAGEPRVTKTTAAVEAPDSSPEALRERSREHVIVGARLASERRPEEAIAQFEKALELDATNHQAHRWLGITHATLANAAEAARHYEAYIYLHPTAPDAEQVRRIVDAYYSTRQ